MQQIPRGFIEWGGGENPVPGKMVKIFCRLEASAGHWDAEPCESSKVRWNHTGGGGDIIAYRVTN